MLFNSPSFLFIFLPVALILSRLIKSAKVRNVVLVILSVVFYAFGDLSSMPILLASVVLNYAAAAEIADSSSEKARKIFLIAGVIFNILILAAFKYTSFSKVLPLGISFFTFQGISYIVDVYRDRSVATKNFIKVFLYIAFFPRLISGPIVKYHEIYDQLDNPAVTDEKTVLGIERFIFGLAKKAILAFYLTKLADAAFNQAYSGQLDFRAAWIGAICYALQIYFDFSGYSDMAIGLSYMLGYRIKENFNLPYAASSMRDFWRRWHISLSQWFRDYLYIPLGGSKKGKLRAAINRMIVFLATGIWHGSGLTFIIWGIGNGLLVVLEGAGIIPAEKLLKSKPGRIVNRIYVIIAAVVLFAVFRATSLAQAGRMLASMFSFRVLPESMAEFSVYLSPMNIVIAALAVAFSGSLWQWIKNRLKLLPDVSFYENHESAASRVVFAILLIAVFALSIMSVARGGFSPFIYSRF